ncbi:unnamed protein product [Cuscuta epithymum]|uniref:RING-type domain-containing protein n=1 Tax=Cuscuta epithymum TaxID=186058 RepID=A0AAV0FHJ1_9ASTE|nr:unnamed protein product [Cuscuta epithymum]
METQAGFVENGGGVAVGFFVRQCQNCFYMFHETDMRTVGCFHLGFCFLCYQKFELDYLIDGAPPAPRLPSPAPCLLCTKIMNSGGPLNPLLRTVVVWLPVVL